jgi:chaperonin cofactor prefoldin
MEKQQRASHVFDLGEYATAKQVGVALELRLERAEKRLDIIEKMIGTIDKKIDALKETR